MNPLSSTAAYGLPPEDLDSRNLGSLDQSADKLDSIDDIEPQQAISISLLEERLRVSYQRRKIGEVVIHKTIETRMVEVPVRYEKLIIEQVSPELRQLAEVDLGGDLTLDPSLVALNPSSIRGEFTSPRFASQILYELGKTLPHQCKRVRIEIELEDSSLTEAYQQRLNEVAEQLASSQPSTSTTTSSWSGDPADPEESPALG